MSTETAIRPRAGMLDARIPSGPLETMWDAHRFEMKLVNPSNRRKYTVIGVGTGLAGGVARGVPFAREYGGLLDNRSFGGAQVSRTFYARGQTGQQLLLGAYQALERQIGLGGVKMYPRHEMLELIVVDGRARGIVTRDLVTGAVESHLGDAVCLATGGYGNVFYLATYARGANATAIWRAYKKGAGFGNPCFTQIHPTCISVTGEHQSKLTLLSESLRNDGRIWVPKQKGDERPPGTIPEDERD